MNEIEVAVRVMVDLLVRGQYVTIERITHGRRLTAGQISSAVSEYGRTLISPTSEWWPLVDITPIDGREHAAFHIAAPLWTFEEGRSDLTLEMALQETPMKVYQSQVLDIHVL